MASIRKRGNSYLIVVSMGYTPDGRRRNPQQKTVKPPKSTLVREKQDIERFKPYLGSYKLVDLRPEHFRSLYTKLRKQKNKATGKPLSEATVEGVHSCLCGILSDAMEGGYLNHNPAWRVLCAQVGGHQLRRAQHPRLPERSQNDWGRNYRQSAEDESRQSICVLFCRNGKSAP